MNVSKGDAVTYGALISSAVLQALEPWRKEAATPPDLHPVLSSPIWAYIPLALLALVGCIWLYRQITPIKEKIAPQGVQAPAKEGNESKNASFEEKPLSQPHVSNQAIRASCSFNDPGPESAVSYFGTLASTGTRLRIFIDLWNGPGSKYHRRKIAEIRDYVRGQDIRIPIVTRFFSPAPDWVFTWGKSNDQLSDRFSISRYAGRITLLNDTGVEQYCYFLIVPTRINGVDYPDVLDSKQLHFIEEWESREAAQH